MHHFALLATTHDPSKPLALPTPCPGGPHDPPKLSALICPICTRRLPATAFKIEHAPPRAGQSALGSAVTTVLTCSDCNGGASRYEGRTHEVRKIIKETSRIGLHYARGGHPAIPTTLTMQDRGDLICTDLKAAFVVAFATLGYQFALAHQLDPIREAIMTGAPPPSTYARMARIDYPRAPENS